MFAGVREAAHKLFLQAKANARNINDLIIFIVGLFDIGSN